MKTIIIHPSDRSTEFLSASYQGQNVDVLTSFNGNDIEFCQHLEPYQRIIAMGHGSPVGLFSVGQFKNIYSVSSLLLYPHKDKRLVFIWCNSDQFVNQFKCFKPELYTGMIISETQEAYYCGIKASLHDINESNSLFAKALASGLFLDQNHILAEVKKIYCDVNTTNPVIKYNQKRIYGF